MEDTLTVRCPWCGETFLTFVDLSAGHQEYIEDCRICCRTMTLTLEVEGNEVVLFEAERA